MAKPAFVGGSDKPARPPAVCRVSPFAPDLPPEWEPVGGRSFGGWGLGALSLGASLGTNLGRVLGTGILLGGVGRSGDPPLLWVFKCVLEEPFSSVGDSSISKVRCCC